MARLEKYFVSVHQRHPSYEGSTIDPFKYPNFVEAIKNNEFGDLTFWFEDEANNVEGREMMVYFRWTTIRENVPDPYLFVAAISKFSVTTNIAKSVFMVLITMIIVTTLIFALIVIHFGKIASSINDTVGIYTGDLREEQNE